MQAPKYAGLPCKKEGDYTPEEREKVREKHNEISARMILDSVKPGSQLSLGLENCREYYPTYIAIVSKYHRCHGRWPLDKVQEQTEIRGRKIRLRLLAALLRFADALDQDHERVNMDILQLVDIPDESKLYWWIHYYIQSIDVENGYIKIILGVLKPTVRIK